MSANAFKKHSLEADSGQLKTFFKMEKNVLNKTDTNIDAGRAFSILVIHWITYPI